MKILNIYQNVQMKNIFFIIIIFLFAFLFIKGIATKRYYQKEINSYKIKIENENKLFIKDLQFLSQEISINCDSIFNYLGNKNSVLLIYAYSGEECNKCIFEDIVKLKKKINNNNEDDIYVLPVLENTRNTSISLEADLSGINYKRLNKGLIEFPNQAGIQRRFFAVLKPNGKILLPFFPEVNSPERTSAYLDFVFAKYFSNNLSAN